MFQRAPISFHGLLAFTLAGFALAATAATDARVSESYGKLPLYFEANRGQTDKAVRYLSRGAGYSLYLTESEAVLALTKPDAKGKGKSVALRMRLVGAARKPVVSGLEEQPGKANYFIGSDSSKWRTNVPTYAKVHYKDVYPGIDLVYYGNQRQLEYDFVVAPGADPKKIVLHFKGTDKMEIDAEGDLVLHAPGGDIRQHKPIIYQELDGIRHEIAGRYVRKGANRVGFKVAAHDTSRPLIIDPVLAYSTYLGGSRAETPGVIRSGSTDSGRFIGVAVDAAGNAYVTGATESLDFPTTSGAFQATLSQDPRFRFAAGGGGQDVFVTKLDSTGSGLVYSTYLGGTTDDLGSGIAVDADGNVYVTGTTQSFNFPTTPLALQRGLQHDSFEDTFVTKLDPSGSVLVYSTYLGGLNDQGFGIAVDTGGNAYVTGEAPSVFPTTPGAFKTFKGAFNIDAFVTKLNPTGSGLVYSTYLGGSGRQSGYGIAVDAGGNIYVTGVTSSDKFPTTPGAFQTSIGGNDDVFVTKLNPAGNGAADLIYSTYLGGSGSENGLGIAVDTSPSPNVYVTGYTDSSNFPTTAEALQTAPGGGEDAFVAKLNPAGSGSADLAYSTYLGGSGADRGYKIALDGQSSPNAYVTGITSSTDFPTTRALQTTSGGLSDAFVTKLNPTASGLIYSTYLGGTGVDQGLGIAVDGSCNAYVTGTTASTDFPTTSGAFQPAFGGEIDVFVAKVVDDVSSCTTTTRSEESAATQIGFWNTYGAETGAFSGGTIVASNALASTALFSFTGTAVNWIGVKCNVCGIAAVSVDGGMPTTVDTSGPSAPGGLASESVFSASALAAGNHTIAIVVTGMSNSGGSYVALDAFDVTAGSAASPPVPSVVLPPPPVTIPPLPVFLGL